MAGLSFLNSSDFHVMDTPKGQIMCTNIPGFSLILFYSTQCKFCKNLIPLFKQIPKSVGGCKFGMINVSNNKECIIRSRQTIAPINVVPYILLYIDGKPYMRYKGDHDISKIANFVVDIAHKIRNQLKKPQDVIKEDKNIKPEKGTDVPSFTLGKPLCGDDNVCYLSLEEAYVPKKK